MAQNKNHLAEITIIRALAIILIVLCHLHLFINAGSFTDLVSKVSDYLAQIGLCLFFFISGFILHYRYTSFKSIKITLKFYYKRLKRIFPLYWIALILFTVIVFNYPNCISHDLNINLNESFTWIIVSLFGLQQVLFTTGRLTYLWFISTIIIFYIIYPLIIYPKYLINKFSAASILFILISLLNLNFNIIEVSTIKYYWIFVFGIMMASFKYYKNWILPKNKRDYVLLLILLPFLVSYITKYYSLAIFLISLISIIIIYVPVNRMSNVLKNSKIYNILDKISTGSYAIYLFHIILFQILLLVLIYLNVSSFYQNIIIVLSIPMVFIVGYYIQVLEFKLISVKLNLPKIKVNIKKIRRY